MTQRNAHRRLFPLRRGFARGAAFAMIEVVVAMTILGIALVAIMKSLTQSLESADIQEKHTMALFLARQMLDEFEFEPPAPGDKAGGFGDAYKYYFFRVHTKIEDADYRRSNIPDEIDRLFGMRTYRLQIVFDDEIHDPDVLLTVNSAWVGFEKFSQATKKAYYEF